eukprot:CAMPEP_0175231608 /NCGR_PEP_ID=MMETSP0093-20121207/25543_1 /TAXON_ID=311494 /ORGANISM="Alexandrium monilatum, Strain CCMP3105" /LENGTH=118 /DNA_ID=CAMNT_0016525463 /DNA_START=87 /DNA_END=440 /DNA_ORIENTATION=-
MPASAAEPVRVRDYFHLILVLGAFEELAHGLVLLLKARLVLAQRARAQVAQLELAVKDDRGDGDGRQHGDGQGETCCHHPRLVVEPQHPAPVVSRPWVRLGAPEHIVLHPQHAASSLG